MILQKRQLTILWIGLGLLIAAFIWDRLFSGDRNSHRYKSQLESYLHPIERTANQFLDDEAFVMGCLASQKMRLDSKGARQMEDLLDAPFNFCVFSNEDSLVFWTKRDVLPEWSDMTRTDTLKVYSKFIEKKASQYELRYRQYDSKDFGRVTAAALIPLKKNYPTLEGRYLNKHFPASPSIPAQLLLVQDVQKEQLNTVEGRLLCYLNSSEANADFVHDWGMGIFLAVGFLFIGIFGHQLAKQLLIQQKLPFWGMTFFVVMMALMRGLILLIQNNNLLPASDLKMSDYYNGIFVHSLSELWIDTLFFFWLAIFFNSEFKLRGFEEQPLWKRWTLSWGFYTFIVLLNILCIGVFSDMVLKWNNLLAFDNLADFNPRSILALLAVSLILLSVFLITHRLMVSIMNLSLRWEHHVTAVAGAIAVGALLFQNFGLQLSTWVYGGIIVCYIYLFRIFVQQKMPKVIWLVIWLMVFSTIQSVFITYFKNEKDENLLVDYAEYLANERDILAEKRMKLLAQNIENDPFIRTLSYAPIRTETNDPKRISEKIAAYYNEDEYLSNQYSFKYFGYNQNNEAIIQEDSADLRSLIFRYEAGQQIDPRKNIRYWSDKQGNWAYIAIAKVPATPENPIFVAMEFRRDDKLTSRVFTELLSNNAFKGLRNLNEYNYAIYKNRIRTEPLPNQASYYDKTIDESEIPAKGQYRYTESNNREEIIYQSKDGIVSKLSKEKTISAEGFTLWTYIILLLCLMLVILAILNHYIKFLPDIVNFSLSFSYKSSFRNRILIPFVAFWLVSFVAIFLFTVRYYKTLDERYYIADLELKNNLLVPEILKEIRNESLSGDAYNQYKLDSLLLVYSHRFQTALHFYNTEGYLVGTTEKNLFDKGIVSKKMNAQAWMTLAVTKDKIFQTHENIGKFHYQTAYYAMRDEYNGVNGYLEIPYYSADRRSKMAAYDVWSYNATFLTLLFFLGIAIIYRQTNKNMAPIQQVADKIQRLTLGETGKNEPIEWTRDDEIGILIKSYNEKIGELEDTYSRISEIEREMAWRDMAKHVAHEIKNPLTPMKLVVQHLEMLRKKGVENIEEYLVRSNRVLLDQIDTLEKIVNEFASFARMPQQASNENFDLNELIASVTSLFSQGLNDNRKAEVNIALPSDEKFIVYGDRSYLTGAFNNLIKNAIQAVPDDRTPKVKVSLYRENTTAIIKISDNGAGIPKEIQNKIFSPNFSTKSYGTGVGLMITKQIIQSVQGRIYFETHENVGTDFFVELNIEAIERKQPNAVSDDETSSFSPNTM